MDLLEKMAVQRYISGYRPGQKKAIEDIIEAVHDGSRVITLDAGTGAGKSLILTIAAQVILKKMEWGKAIYSTPQVKLVRQIMNDEALGIPVLIGKRNYPCKWIPSFTADDCLLTRGDRICRQCKSLHLPEFARCERYSRDATDEQDTVNVLVADCTVSDDFIHPGCYDCPYDKAKAHFLRAPVSACTFDKLLFDQSINECELLIIDECQNLENMLMKQAEIALPFSATKEDIHTKLLSWSQGTAKMHQELKEEVKKMVSNLKSGGPVDKLELLKKRKAASTLEKQIRKIEYIMGLIASGQPFVISKDDIFKPLDARKQFAFLKREHETIILASGTPCTQILTNDFKTVTMPNPIPTENGLIYFEAIGKMSYDKRETTIPEMAQRIEHLHEEYGQNTLVHCHSYQIADKIYREIRDSETVLMNKYEKEEQIRQWKKREHAILLSVDSEEGLDLMGPRFPLNIIAVVPFPFRGDEWVVEREKIDKVRPIDQRYSVLYTVLKLEQAPGRTTRGPEDRSTSYILDTNFLWFLQRNRAAFRQDYLARIRFRR